jgi:hypothetical protein
MDIKKIKSSLYFVFIIFIACQSGGFDNFCGHLFARFTDSKKVIFLIPSEGCTGCISQITSYLLINTEIPESVGIIYTNIRDKKAIKILLSPLKNNVNLIFDLENSFFRPDHKWVNYPTVIIRSENGFSERLFEIGDTVFLREH